MRDDCLNVGEARFQISSYRIESAKLVVDSTQDGEDVLIMKEEDILGVLAA